jgi:hypothetical protein
MMTTVIHCKGDRTSHGDVVYIGRPSKWGNPFVIGRDGDRRAVIAKYEAWLLGRLALPCKRPPSLAEIRHELRGKKLAWYSLIALAAMIVSYWGIPFSVETFHQGFRIEH